VKATPAAGKRSPGWAVAALTISAGASLCAVGLAALGYLAGGWLIALLAVAAGALLLAIVARWLPDRRAGRRLAGGNGHAENRSDPRSTAARPTPRPVERRSFLGTEISVAAGALGAAAVATVSSDDRAGAPSAAAARPVGAEDSEAGGQQPIDIWEYAEQVVDRPTGDDPASWDWTPALRAAVQAAALRAGTIRRLPGQPEAFRRDRLPMVRLPQGRYRIRGPVALRYLHGFTLRGDGPEATVLVLEGGTTLFDINRSHAVTFAGFSIEGDPPRYPGRSSASCSGTSATSAAPCGTSRSSRAPPQSRHRRDRVHRSRADRATARPR